MATKQRKKGGRKGKSDEHLEYNTKGSPGKSAYWTPVQPQPEPERTDQNWEEEYGPETRIVAHTEHAAIRERGQLWEEPQQQQQYSIATPEGQHPQTHTFGHVSKIKKNMFRPMT